MKTKPLLHCCLTGIIIVFACLTDLQGQILISHIGNADPTTEGFTLGSSSTGSGVTLSGVTSPENAWRITDSSTVLRPRYEFTGMTANALDAGFSMSARVRTPSTDAIDNAAVLNLIYEGTEYTIRFGLNASGNSIVDLVGAGGGSFTLGSGGFHDYRLDFQGGLGQFYIDNILQLSSYTGAASGLGDIFRFGGISTGHTTPGVEYAAVQLSAVPEPSAYALLGVGLGALLLLRRHRHKV